MSTAITVGVSIAAFKSGAGLHVGIPLSGTNLLFSIATAIIQKPFKIFTIKRKNNMYLSCSLKAG